MSKERAMAIAKALSKAVSPSLRNKIRVKFDPELNDYVVEVSFEIFHYIAPQWAEKRKGFSYWPEGDLRFIKKEDSVTIY